MKAVGVIAILVSVLSGGCTSTSAPIIENLGPFVPRYEIVDDRQVVITTAEEHWCTTLEGSSGAWLTANERDLIFNPSSGEPDALDIETVRLLEIVVAEGTSAISPDEFDQLDTLLRFPIPSPLACKAAYDIRDE